MQDNRLLLALTIILGSGVGLSMLLHWFIVCPILYKHGARFPTGLLVWRQWREMRLFKEVLAAEARSLTVYYAGCALLVFNFVLLIVVLYATLWAKTGQPS
jgi:hypothetical protein